MLYIKNIFLDSEGNALRLSSVTQTEQQVQFQNFSAKYVVSGNENYVLNNRKIKIKEGEYVIGNKNINSNVLIDHSEPVKGICIDIAKDIFTEIIDYQFENSIHFSRFLFDQEWVSQKYQTKYTSLGYALNQLSKKFNSLEKGSSQINKELFYVIAECVIKDQSQVFKGFSNLKAVKEETKGRLFNYVYDAKNFIDINFLESINIELIAKEAKLSEYHFIRLFKTIFNTTPHKYIIKKKLELALDLIKNKYSITDISLILGYNDTAAFSNAFKNYFGHSPNKL
jgi:AraC-like DNA-binding protein